MNNRKQLQNQPSKKRRGCLWWGLWGVAGFTFLFVGLFLVAFISEKIALASLPDKYPPPGEIIDVGDYSLHLDCNGDTSDKPVVVVSSGYSASSIHWALVTPEVAKFTRICAYDRAGSGYSFTPPLEGTYHQEADDLHTLLQNAGVPGPYVLVGHSFGGAVMQVYAIQYPEEVAGLVMVDSNTRGSDDRIPEQYIQARDRYSMGIAAFSIPGVFRILNWFGMYRTDPFVEQLPADLRATAYALDFNSRMFTFQTVMARSDDQREAQFIAEGSLPDVPMIVITHGIPWAPLPGVDEATSLLQEQVLQEMQAELANETSDGTLLVAEQSQHNINVDQPQIVIDAISTIVEKTRGE